MVESQDHVAMSSNGLPYKNILKYNTSSLFLSKSFSLAEFMKEVRNRFLTQGPKDREYI